MSSLNKYGPTMIYEEVIKTFIIKLFVSVFTSWCLNCVNCYFTYCIPKAEVSSEPECVSWRCCCVKHYTDWSALPFQPCLPHLISQMMIIINFILVIMAGIILLWVCTVSQLLILHFILYRSHLHLIHSCWHILLLILALPSCLIGEGCVGYKKIPADSNQGQRSKLLLRFIQGDDF